MNNWDYLLSLASNPIFLVLAGCASIVSLALAIYFGVRSHRFKRLGYCSKSTSFVRDYQTKIPELELSYKGIKVRNITLTRFVVWNSGVETVHKTDIAKADPLRLTVADASAILNSEIVPPVRESNVVRLQSTADRQTLELSFDFLDKEDGVVFDVLHTGRAGDVSLSGTIKGARQLKYYHKVRVPLSQSQRLWIWAALLILVALIALLSTIFASPSPIRSALVIFVALFLLAGAIAADVAIDGLAEAKTLPRQHKHFMESI